MKYLCEVTGCNNPATHKGEWPNSIVGGYCEKCADELNELFGVTTWNVEFEGVAETTVFTLDVTPAYYTKHVKCKSCGENTGVDVYDVLKAFDVKCPAIQHAVKKLLRCGSKPGEDELAEINGAIKSLVRAKEMRGLVGFPDEPRRDSGVALDGVVLNSGSEEVGA